MPQYGFVADEPTAHTTELTWSGAGVLSDSQYDAVVGLSEQESCVSLDTADEDECVRLEVGMGGVDDVGEKLLGIMAPGGETELLEGAVERRRAAISEGRIRMEDRVKRKDAAGVGYRAKRVALARAMWDSEERAIAGNGRGL